MLNEIKSEAKQRMEKSLISLDNSFKKIRTGRAHPSLLDGIMVSYYGSPTPLSQVANITAEDNRTLMISPWEKQLAPEIEKALLKSDLGINPSSNGDVIRIPLPSLTEETRKVYIKQAKSEAEGGRVSMRNIRRDANGQIKDLLKEKEISEDEERGAQDDIQKLTDSFIAKVEALLKEKEADLMAI